MPMTSENLVISPAMVRWIVGGACIGAMIYGGFLLSAVNKVGDQIDRVNFRMEQMVPRDTHVLVWAEDKEKFAHLENEIQMLMSKKADAEGIVRDQAVLGARIEELNRRLGYSRGGGQTLLDDQRGKRR